MSPDVTAETWRRLLDEDVPIEGLVAERDGEIVGFVNCVLHPTTRGAAETCYSRTSSFRPMRAEAVRGGP